MNNLPIKAIYRYPINTLINKIIALPMPEDAIILSGGFRGDPKCMDINIWAAISLPLYPSINHSFILCETGKSFWDFCKDDFPYKGKNFKYLNKLEVPHEIIHPYILHLLYLGPANVDHKEQEDE